MKNDAATVYPRLRSSLLAIVVLGFGVGHGHDLIAQGTTPTARPAWTRLDLTAHKLVVSATPVVTAAIASADSLAGELITAKQGTPIAAPAGDLLVLTTSMTAMHRTFDTRLLMDPTTGQAIQLTETETGAKTHRRLYRFCTDGVFERSRLPSGSTESSLPPEQWTQVTETFTAISSSGQEPLLGPVGLLWMLSDPKLAKPGDQVTAKVWAKGQAEDVTLEAASTQSANPSFSISGGGASVSPSPTDLVVDMTSAPAAGASNLELLGLQGDITVTVDSNLRVPVSLQGTLASLGKLTVQLAKVELAASQP